MSQETFQPVEQLSHGDDLPDHFAAALRNLPARRRLPHVNAWRASRGLAPLDRLPRGILHRRATAGKVTPVHDRSDNAAGASEVHGPSLLRRVANFTRAITRHVRDGFGKVDDAEYQARLAVCGTCEANIDGKCTDVKCGCVLAIKARWRSESCPRKKWKDN